jgi:hypothetical protein
MVKYKGSVLLKRPKSGPVYYHLWHSPCLGFDVIILVVNCCKELPDVSLEHPQQVEKGFQLTPQFSPCPRIPLPKPAQQLGRMLFTLLYRAGLLVSRICAFYFILDLTRNNTLPILYSNYLSSNMSIWVYESLDFFMRIDVFIILGHHWKHLSK